MGLSLHRARGEAANKVFTCNHINEKGGQCGDNGGGHIHIIFLHAGGGVDDVVQCNGDGLCAGLAERHTKQEIVPDLGELPNNGNHNDGWGNRQKD